MSVTTDPDITARLFRAVYGKAAMDAMLTEMGPPPPAPSWHVRLSRRAYWRWHDARVWVAEKILRLPQGRDDLY